MKKLTFTLLIVLLLFSSTEGAFARSYRTKASDVYVGGYTKSNGTYVSPYYRSQPDGIMGNNYSCIDGGNCGGLGGGGTTSFAPAPELVITKEPQAEATFDNITVTVETNVSSNATLKCESIIGQGYAYQDSYAKLSHVIAAKVLNNKGEFKCELKVTPGDFSSSKAITKTFNVSVPTVSPRFFFTKEPKVESTHNSITVTFDTNNKSSALLACHSTVDNDSTYGDSYSKLSHQITAIYFPAERAYKCDLTVTPADFNYTDQIIHSFNVSTKIDETEKLRIEAEKQRAETERLQSEAAQKEQLRQARVSLRNNIWDVRNAARYGQASVLLKSDDTSYPYYGEREPNRWQLTGVDYFPVGWEEIDPTFNQFAVTKDIMLSVGHGYPATFTFTTNNPTVCNIAVYYKQFDSIHMSRGKGFSKGHKFTLKNGGDKFADYEFAFECVDSNNIVYYSPFWAVWK